MNRSRYALQPVCFVMFQLSILVRMWGDLQYGMPARAGQGVARIWKALQRALALPVVERPQTGADGMGSPEADGITDQTDIGIFGQNPGADRLDRTAIQVSGPANWLASQPGGAGRRGRYGPADA